MCFCFSVTSCVSSIQPNSLRSSSHLFVFVVEPRVCHFRPSLHCARRFSWLTASSVSIQQFMLCPHVCFRSSLLLPQHSLCCCHCRFRWKRVSSSDSVVSPCSLRSSSFVYFSSLLLLFCFPPHLVGRDSNAPSLLVQCGHGLCLSSSVLFLSCLFVISCAFPLACIDILLFGHDVSASCSREPRNQTQSPRGCLLLMGDPGPPELV